MEAYLYTPSRQGLGQSSMCTNPGTCRSPPLSPPSISFLVEGFPQMLLGPKCKRDYDDSNPGTERAPPPPPPPCLHRGRLSRPGPHPLPNSFFHCRLVPSLLQQLPPVSAYKCDIVCASICRRCPLSLLRLLLNAFEECQWHSSFA